MPAYRDPVLSAAEVRAILRRALQRAEIEEAARGGGDGEGGRGHTLEELKQIAGDAGISETALQAALAGETEPPEQAPEPLSLAGAPARISTARTVRGHLAAIDRETLSRAMREATGDLGSVQSTGGGWIWASTVRGPRNVFAVVEPAGEGRLGVRIEENLRARQQWTFISVGMLGGTLGLAVVAPFFRMLPHGAMPFALAAWFLFMYLLARETYVLRFHARKAEVAKLVGTLVSIVGATGTRVDPELAEAREADEAVLVDNATDDEEAADASGRARRRA